MYLQINEIKVHDDGRVHMQLEYDETFRQKVAAYYKKKTVTKQEIHSFIIEKLDSILEKDSTLIERLGGLKPDA